jgi:hypothetical protein
MWQLFVAVNVKPLITVDVLNGPKLTPLMFPLHVIGKELAPVIATWMSYVGASSSSVKGNVSADSSWTTTTLSASAALSKKATGRWCCEVHNDATQDCPSGGLRQPHTTTAMAKRSARRHRSCTGANDVQFLAGRRRAAIASSDSEQELLFFFFQKLIFSALE